MDRICQGRVAIVTGAGRGLGRSHALELAQQGATVIVNELDTTPTDGVTAGEAVVREIEALGGRAIADSNDISDWDGAGRLVSAGIDTFGHVDVVVNNAGNLRDRMFVNMDVEDFDAVIKVHLRGTFCVARHLAGYWRERTKAGDSVAGRIINTTSGAGLYGNIGQVNYVAAKAGIAGMTLALAAELERYGVTVNAISPIARTRMTAALFSTQMDGHTGDFDRNDPGLVSPLVSWLASTQSNQVTGQVFSMTGGRLSVLSGWKFGPTKTEDRAWSAREIGAIALDLLEQAEPPTPVRGTPAAELKLDRANG
jgi:NAD(P)-dependent dehydrogenase (short-subunit alcohol dehydrogenase family)